VTCEHSAMAANKLGEQGPFQSVDDCVNDLLDMTLVPFVVYLFTKLLT